MKTQYEKGDTTGIKRAFHTLYEVKQQENNSVHKYHFYTNNQRFTNITPFDLKQIFHNTRVSLRVSVIKGH